MNRGSGRATLTLLTNHWISMLGVALVTTAGFSWLFVLPLHVRGHVDNPYIGLVVFIIIPIVFFLGLVLIPIGIALARRRISEGLAAAPDRTAAWRRLALFLGVMTLVNILIGSQVTYRAVQQMETVQFCGQTCHVMKPEFTAHQMFPHQKVECVECHVAPGASGWVNSKMSGTRQLMAVIFNNYPRPIQSAMESNRLVPSAETCEHCHGREKYTQTRIRIISKFRDDQTNTLSQTVLTMLVGGGRFGGIHGVHMGPGVRIRYAAADAKRQTIPWVEYRDGRSGQNRIYVSSDAKPAAINGLPKFEMQCVDCHNRPAHAFEAADRAVDDALATGQIPTGLPFAKKTSVELLKVDYKSQDDAGQKIPAAFAAFYRQKYPEVYANRTHDVDAAGQAVLAIHDRNVFPDLKVTWGAYPNNLGHTDYPGCFRCHDESHSTTDKKTITQDCAACHQAVAVEEASPEVLKTLGLADKISNLQRQ